MKKFKNKINSNRVDRTQKVVKYFNPHRQHFSRF